MLSRTISRVTAKRMVRSATSNARNAMSKNHSQVAQSTKIARHSVAAFSSARPSLNASMALRMFSAAAGQNEFPLVVPTMGESITEGTVVEWLKNPGDYVEEDEVMVVLETDKVSVDVRAPKAGVLVKYLANVDDSVDVGAELAVLEEGDAPAASAATPAAETESSATTPQGEPEDVVVPTMGESITEGTIVQWMVSPGDFVAEDDVLAVLETDKVSVDVRAPFNGTVAALLEDVDAVVEVGAPLAKIVPGGEAPKKVETAAPAAPEATPEVAQPSTPAPAATPAPASTPAPAAAVAETEPVAQTGNRTERREKMSRMRQAIAKNMKLAQNNAASLTTFQEVDMGNLMDMRKKYKDSFEEVHGNKLGFMSAFSKATAMALQEVPSLNAQIDNETNEIVYKDYVDISVAVATPKGLVTPVLRNVEEMSFVDIERTLAELAVKAREGKMTMEEMTGGNFTISNGGVFGSLMGTPILNNPQSGVLGMHGTKMRPVVRNGEIVARPMMYLALTYDHRLVDGREAVTCLKSIADKIADPERMLLGL